MSSIRLGRCVHTWGGIPVQQVIYADEFRPVSFDFIWRDHRAGYNWSQWVPREYFAEEEQMAVCRWLETLFNESLYN